MGFAHRHLPGAAPGVSAWHADKMNSGNSPRDYDSYCISFRGTGGDWSKGVVRLQRPASLCGEPWTQFGKFFSAFGGEQADTASERCSSA